MSLRILADQIIRENPCYRAISHSYLISTGLVENVLSVTGMITPQSDDPLGLIESNSAEPMDIDTVTQYDDVDDEGVMDVDVEYDTMIQTSQPQTINYTTANSNSENLKPNHNHTTLVRRIKHDSKRSLVIEPITTMNACPSRVQQRKPILVLDMDETLVHSSMTPYFGCTLCDLQLDVIINKQWCTFYINFRPKVDYFLQCASQWFDLVIFTAGLKEYAAPILKKLDGEKGYFKQCLYRDSCTLSEEGVYLKDLSLFQSDMATIALLDNSPLSFGLQPDNGVPIDSWYSDPFDKCLVQILPFLKQLSTTKDLRPMIRNYDQTQHQKYDKSC